MFETIRQLFKKENKDIRKRVYFTLGALAIYLMGTLIQVPNTTPITAANDFIDLMDLMGGGALKQFSILGLGVMPYITASIIIQLLQMDVIPYLTELGKQGEVGRRKINQITRYVGLALAFIQGYSLSIAFDRSYNIINEADAFTYVGIALILTAGTAFALWLGDQITAKGIGNGISLIIGAGIIERLPNMFSDAFNALFDKTSTQSMFIGAITFTLFVAMFIAIIVGVIYVQQATRKVPIQYANRTHSAYGAKQSYIPIKLNSAGVIPVIFASSILTAPLTIAQFFEPNNVTKFISTVFDYRQPIGLTLYVLLIVGFVYMYTFIQIKPDDLAENLQKSNGYIPGIRPGKETSEYVKRILMRVTFTGAIFLAVIAALPILFTKFTSLPTSVQIGGTGLLIVIGVALETVKQLEGQLIGRSYQGYITK